MYSKASRASEASANINKNPVINRYNMPVSLRSTVKLGLSGALISMLLPVVQATGPHGSDALTSIYEGSARALAEEAPDAPKKKGTATLQVPETEFKEMIKADKKKVIAERAKWD